MMTLKGSGRFSYIRVAVFVAGAVLSCVAASGADGFYRVRHEDGGRWWVVDPDGERTFLRGVDHANWNGHWCEALNINPYREENKKRYASQGAWETETLDRLKAWGFNTLGAGCSPELEGRGLAHCVFLALGELFARQGRDHALSEAQGIPGTAFPNVFHKDWESFCDVRAAKLCAGRKGDRNLVGYFFDNELNWRGRSAEEARRYFGTIAAAIRKHDPNHLLLGCRFAGLDSVSKEVWQEAGRFCDIVTFNQYPWADLDENVVYTSRASGVRIVDACAERYSWTKKPLMITEWSFPALDSGLPCTGGAGQRFRTQSERVKATELFARTLFALPFMVGSDYFMWVDEPALGISRKFPENSNYGLVDGCGKPYAELTEMFARLNPEADALHKRGELPSARAVDRKEEARAALFPKIAADASARCVRDGDAYTLRTGAGLVLKGRIGGRAAFDSVVADGVECGPFTFMLYHGRWDDIGCVESAEWIQKAGALRIAGIGGSGGRTFRIVCDIVPIAGRSWFACNVVRAENTGTEEFADASVWLRQYSPWAADSWQAGGERSVPSLWKSQDCGVWIRSGDGAWCGAATFAKAVRIFTYWVSGDGAMHPDAAFGGTGLLRLAPGGKWTPEGRAWMVAAAGKGGEKGWRGFLDDFAAWRDEVALKARLPEVFAKCAAHYRALDASATPLMKGADGKNHVPHGYSLPRRSLGEGGRGKGRLDMRNIYWWTAGHFAGAFWLLYEATGDAFFRDRAVAWTEILAPNSKVTDNHDVGFIMYCSFGNARRLLNTDRYDALLLEAAGSLSTRFNDKLGLIRSWGAVDDRDGFLVIPDNMMNLELLEWAAKAKGGERRVDEIARSHADVTMRHHFRADGGTYHVLNYCQKDGRVQEVRRGQGASCETAWSRGQSWAIYGYTMIYRETRDKRYLDFAQKLADFAINNPNMPEDGIPYWDYGAPGEERDSSAGAIMASGLVELAQLVGGEKGAAYRAFAVKQLTSLSSSVYFSEGDEIGHFLLKHGVGHKPANSEIDTPLVYGDYYYLEALLRLRK